MKKLLFVYLLINIITGTCAGQLEKTRILYGPCTADSLRKTPFDKWYNPGYEAYQPDSNTLVQLRKINTSNIRVDIYFGSWCGDSKREVPRMLKLLHAMGFPAAQLRMIAVGGSDSLYKQSPAHEEAGKGIFRVPVFIVYANGTETGRINEYPVYSLERDLLSILKKDEYTPNYPAFATIRQWLNTAVLTDMNITATGLATVLKKLVNSEHELNSLGYLLLNRGDIREALRIFQVNSLLYPESSNVASSLGEGYYENGDIKKAITALERSLRIAGEKDELKPVLDLLYKIREKEKQ